MNLKPEYEACLRSVGRLVDDVLALEAMCRDLTNENYKLRDQLARTSLGDIDAGEFAYQLTLQLGIEGDEIDLADVTKAIAATKASPFATGGPSCGVCLDGHASCPVVDPPGVTQWTCLACGKYVGEAKESR